MDKQKQMVEEMIKDMCEEYGKECNECPCSGTCANEQLAYDLIEKGYRKIPENAVVLTREEYEKLGLFVETVQEYESQNGQPILVKERKVVKKLPTDIVEFVRKETAKNFAKMAKEEAFVVFMGEPIIRASKIDEICEEITEGKE